MAQVTITLPDELDARLRRRLGDQDVAEYIKAILTDQLDDEDPIVQAEVVRKARQSIEEIDAGLGLDGREAMRELARQKGLRFDR